MLFLDESELRQRIAALTGRTIRGAIAVFEDTSAFTAIDTGGVIRLAGSDYLVLGNAREGRFGIDDQPKLWVKHAIDLTSGRRKVLKLVFDEAFDIPVGPFVYRCSRSPRKEAVVLQETRGDPAFMQGEAAHDAAGNLVRVLDFVTGVSLYEHLRRLEMPHDEYYSELMPAIMKSVLESFEGIRRLHELGLNHGDIRADHLLVRGDGRCVWIDFDYDVPQRDYDVLCLGNVLLQVAGKGRHSAHDVACAGEDYPGFDGALTPGDMSLLYRHRVANLKKLFPHVADDLNDVLMSFSAQAPACYRDVDSLLADLRSALSAV